MKRIIYVGALGSDHEALSPHLRSRQEVGHLLRESGVPVLELRASIVIGSGSLSFEIIRSLVERLPVSQYAVFEIGGADRVCYADIMREYARQRGLRIRMLRVPALTPYLSSLWLGLVTPLYARIGRKLIESIIHPTVVRDDAASTTFAVRPIGIEEAIRRALAHEEREFAETRWSDALSSSGEPRSWGGVRLAAEMKLPGRAWLEFEVAADGASTTIQQTAIFDPVGWLGRLYWYALFPLHELVFAGMMRGIARTALRARPKVSPLHDDR